MLNEFTTEPRRWTMTERRVFILMLAAIAISRVWALAPGPWDWDEILFARGVLEFDVPGHRPHPPGFPLFIAAGKLLFPLFGDAFRALQSVSLIAAIALFPSTVFLAREARLSPQSSMFAGTLLSFLPTPWFFGATAFSDVPAMVLVVLALACFLRGFRHRWSIVLGAIVLAAAVGIRSQNLVVGAVPFCLASFSSFRRKRFAPPLIAAAGMVAIVVATYSIAASASGGWTAYSDAIAHHRNYIASVDSFRAEGRPSLPKLVDDFFVRHYRTGSFDYLLTLLAVAGLVEVVRGKRPPLAWLVIAFLPFCISAWLLLDVNSIGRFALGYLPIFVMLIATALDPASRNARRSWLVVAVALASYTAARSIPAIHASKTTSPTTAAMRWIREHVDPSNAKLYVAFGMIPFVEYHLPEYSMVQVLDERAIPVEGRGEESYLITEGATGDPSGKNFLRPREDIWRVVRQRYFEVCVVPLRTSARFAEGWYEAENHEAEVWRWMGGKSKTFLPPLKQSRGALRIEMQFPLDTLRTVPVVTIRWNGTVIDRFQPRDWQMQREYEVASVTAGENELIIETSVVVNPRAQGLNDDPRDLGLLLRSMSWGPSPSRN